MKKAWILCLSLFLLSSLFAVALPFQAADAATMQPLSHLNALGGSWSFGDTVTSSGSGDLFALSDTTAKNFILEADVTFKAGRHGAASLVCFASDTPSTGAYVANIDLGAQNARIFAFTKSGAITKGEYTLSSAEKVKTSFHLRLEVIGDCIAYYLDGAPIVTLRDASQKPGARLGLLTFDTSVTYENIRYAALDGQELLKGLSTPTGSITPSLVMTYRVPYGTTSLPLSLETDGTASVSATKGATPSLNKKTVAVTNIREDFTLTLAVTKGDITVHYLVNVSIEQDPNSVYNEPWRSQYHFSPFVNWLNDPNGLVFDPSDQSYHLFFQYNPFGLTIANQVWAHAVSTDLIHWKELGVAIDQDHLGAVFSGSAVVDENNTSGFFTDNKPGESKLVALFTSDGGDTTYGVEKQCIAYSKDHGVTWIRPSIEKDGFENPILQNENNKYGRDFRDPKIFWYDGKWFMVIAGGRARLFTSNNLIDWTLVCDMGFDSECPDFYPLAVDGDENNIKWVYVASGRWYSVGRLEKLSDTAYRFVEEGERMPYNGGGEVYATQSYYNDGSGNNRRIAISWIQDSSAQSLDNKGWNGAMTLPYEQTLRTVGGKLLLCSYPVAEVNTLRGEKLISLENTSADTLNEALSSHPAVAYDAEIVFSPKDNATVTFTLRQNGKHGTRLIYDATAHTLRVIRSQAGSEIGAIPTGNLEMPLSPDENGKITLRILMDTTILEVFGNEGEAPLCGMIFPDADGIGNTLSVDGEVTIERFSLWQMGSIWHNDAPILVSEGIYFESDRPYFGIGDTVTVSAYYIDENGKRQNAVTLEAADSAAVKILKKEGATVMLEGASLGTVTLNATYQGKEKSLTLKITDTLFVTDLENWSSKGDWYIDENGYSIAGSSGDSFSFSSMKNKGDFTYQGVLDFHQKGGCLGLVFAASHPQTPTDGIWFGANIDTHGASPVMKLFCNRNGNEIWRETKTLSDSADTWTLMLTYKDGVLLFSVNGTSVSHKLQNLPSGYLGVVSWNGGGSFSEVRYQAISNDTPDPTPDTDTPVSTDTPITDTPTQDTPTSSDSPTEKGEKPREKSVLLPILLGAAGVLAVAGAITAWYVFKKKKS